MPTTVLFHCHCPDGHASAFACWQRFGDEARYIPVAYGEPCPEIDDDHNVYIVDFSYPAETLQRLLAARIGRRTRAGAVVTVIDHHASAEQDLLPLARQQLPGLLILFDMRESGASLTWKYLRTAPDELAYLGESQELEQRLPTFFKYVRDRDLWQWQLPDSKAVSLAYWALDKDFLNIEQFAQNLDDAEGYHRIVTEGTAMQRYADALVKEQAARATVGTIGGYLVPIVNATTLFSEVGDYLCTTHPEIPFCAYYFFRDANTVQWGLRSRNDVDVSVIAKQFQGGGHKQAAGFVTTIEQCIQILHTMQDT